MPYTRNTSGTTADGILAALADLASGGNHSPYVRNNSGTTLEGILTGLEDLVRGTDRSPYVRNTSGTTWDGILAAITDLVKGQNHSPYVRNSKGTTLDGVLDALTDCVTGADRRPYAISSAGTTINGWREALTDIVANGGIGPSIHLSANSLQENSAQGTAIGILSVANATGTPAFTLTDSAGNKIQLAGTNNVNVQAGSVAADYEAATSFTFTVSVSGVTPTINPKTFTINVLDVAEGGVVVNDDDWAVWMAAA